MNDALQKSGFDELDRAILEELQVNGRISVADLARKIHLSQPAVHNRMKRLEREGIIQAYVALLDREKIGYDLLCFVQVAIQPHSSEQICKAQAAIKELPEVLECYRLTGDYDLMLKVAVANSRALDEFVSQRLTILEGVDRIHTHIVLNEVKSTTALSLK
jgi:DNA-binding Lrp family transcriptional regulator